MYQLIDELITKLDGIKDAFLIGLLEAKKSELDDIKIYIDPERIRELNWWAASEVRKIIPFSYQKEIDKIKKLNKTIFNCDICPLAQRSSITNELQYAEDSKVCDSCCNKQWKLSNYERHLEKMHEKIVQEIIATDQIVEIIRMKSMIKTVNRKLKNL